MAGRSRVEPGLQGLSCASKEVRAEDFRQRERGGHCPKAATPGHQGRDLSGLVDGLWRGAKDPTETIRTCRKARITCVAGCITPLHYMNYI